MDRLRTWSAHDAGEAVDRNGDDREVTTRDRRCGAAKDHGFHVLVGVRRVDVREALEADQRAGRELHAAGAQVRLPVHEPRVARRPVEHPVDERPRLQVVEDQLQTDVRDRPRVVVLGAHGDQGLRCRLGVFAQLAVGRDLAHERGEGLGLQLLSPRLAGGGVLQHPSSEAGHVLRLVAGLVEQIGDHAADLGQTPRRSPGHGVRARPTGLFVRKQPVAKVLRGHEVVEDAPARFTDRDPLQRVEQVHVERREEPEPVLGGEPVVEDPDGDLDLGFGRRGDLGGDLRPALRIQRLSDPGLHRVHRGGRPGDVKGEDGPGVPAHRLRERVEPIAEHPQEVLDRGGAHGHRRRELRREDAMKPGERRPPSRHRRRRPLRPRHPADDGLAGVLRELDDLHVVAALHELVGRGEARDPRADDDDARLLASRTTVVHASSPSTRCR